MREERRRFSRVPFKVNTEIAINDVVYSVDEIINLSVENIYWTSLWRRLFWFDMLKILAVVVKFSKDKKLPYF